MYSQANVAVIGWDKVEEATSFADLKTCDGVTIDKYVFTNAFSVANFDCAGYMWQILRAANHNFSAWNQSHR